MRLPVFKSKDPYKRRVVAFGGINRLQGSAEGEIYDCSGISHDSFPALTQRRKIELEFPFCNPVAAIFANKECVVADGVLYYDRKAVGTLSEGAKTLVQMGNRIVIFPDKMYYDTKTDKLLRLDGECRLTDVKVNFENNKITLPEVSHKTVSTVETLTVHDDASLFRYSEADVVDGVIILSEAELVKAKDLSNGDIFSETSGTQCYRIVQNVASENGETSILNECISVEITGKDVFSHFVQGDIVEINGCECTTNNKQVKVVEAGADYLLFEDGTFEEKTETVSVIIRRNIPDFSCMCVYKNRLWGCSGNTIYASALGDPRNYFKYSNLSTDSFTIESDSSGDFTAATVYGNYCLFFKEDRCYPLFGDRPANFQLVEAFFGGISKDNSESIANIDGKIIYKGHGGIYTFCGGNPQNISEKLGKTEMNNCVAGSYLDCYYLSADTENGREEFVFDTKHGLWSKSGIRDVKDYFSYGGKMYRLMNDGIYFITEETDNSHEWFAEFCPFDEDYYKTKNYSRIYITAQLFENSVIKTEISRDGGEWQTVSHNYGNEKEYINIPCPIKRCHEVRVRISGKGKSIVESIVREFSVN